MKTTQPAHMVTLISALILAKILTPDEKTSDTSTPPIYMKLLYLASVSAHFGIQIWMTFVSGLALYLCVPRHTFGEVQKVLFPKYFLINALLSLITLSTFMQCQDEQTNQVCKSYANSCTLLYNESHTNKCILNIYYFFLQIIGLVICFCVELVIRLYLAPVLLKLTTEKNIMEAAAGVGMEIGKHKAGSLAKCPIYTKLHKTFRKVHMTIAIGNMITMACTTFHLYFLSHKISI